MSKRSTLALEIVLKKNLNCFAQEWNISNMEMVGVLEAVKTDIIMQTEEASDD